MSDFDVINNSIYDVITNAFNNWIEKQKVDMNTPLKVNYSVEKENDIVRYNVTITINDL